MKTPSGVLGSPKTFTLGEGDTLDYSFTLGNMSMTFEVQVQHINSTEKMVVVLPSLDIKNVKMYTL